MTDVHRRFLQLLMTHGVLEEWGVRRLQKHCYRVHDREYHPLGPGVGPPPPPGSAPQLGLQASLCLTPARFSSQL